MKSIKCFEVLGHTDTTEGRGPMKVVARFSNKEAALLYVKSKRYAEWCVMGCLSSYDVNNIKETTIIIMESVEEIDEAINMDRKARALAKLSDEEKKLLGLM